MANDIGVIAWHEDGRWSVAELETEDLTEIIDRLKGQRTNGGAVGLISIDEDFFIVARALGSSLQMMISDVTFALENDLAADLVDVLDLPFPEEEDESQPGGDVDLLVDLGMNVMELEALASDPELFPDEAISAIAHRLGFGPQFDELYD
jgi:putative tRNA adenosine deaminase-associated protein